MPVEPPRMEGVPGGERRHGRGKGKCRGRQVAAGRAGVSRGVAAAWALGGA